MFFKASIQITKASMNAVVLGVHSFAQMLSYLSLILYHSQIMGSSSQTSLR